MTIEGDGFKIKENIISLISEDWQLAQKSDNQLNLRRLAVGKKCWNIPPTSQVCTEETRLQDI